MKTIAYTFLFLFLSVGAKANAQKAVGAGISGISSYATLVAMSGAGANATFSEHFSACCGTGAGSPACCPMAALSAAGAVMMLVNAGESSGVTDTASCDANSAFCNWNHNLGNGTNNGGQAGNGTDFGYDMGTAGSENNPTGSGNQNQAMVQQSLNAARARIQSSANGIINEMRAKGYELTSDGKYVKNPDGTHTPVSAFSSPSAMKDHGFTGAQIAAVEQVKDQLKGMDPMANLKKYGFGYSGGNGAGWKQAGKRGSANKGPDYNKMFNQFLNKDKKAGKQARGVAAAAGLSKKLSNGENIGVAADNIFHMVHRRYQKKTAERSFMP